MFECNILMKFVCMALQIVPIPKYSSPVVNRFMKPLSRGYHDLASAYATGLSEDVRNVTFRYRDLFVRDNNLGLVKQVRNAKIYSLCCYLKPTNLVLIDDSRWPPL